MTCVYQALATQAGLTSIIIIHCWFCLIALFLKYEFAYELNQSSWEKNCTSRMRITTLSIIVKRSQSEIICCDQLSVLWAPDPCNSATWSNQLTEKAFGCWDHSCTGRCCWLPSVLIMSLEKHSLYTHTHTSVALQPGLTSELQQLELPKPDCPPP